MDHLASKQKKSAMNVFLGKTNANICFENQSVNENLFDDQTLTMLCSLEWWKTSLEDFLDD